MEAGVRGVPGQRGRRAGEEGALFWVPGSGGLSAGRSLSGGCGHGPALPCLTRPSAGPELCGRESASHFTRAEAEAGEGSALGGRTGTEGALILESAAPP